MKRILLFCTLSALLLTACEKYIPASEDAAQDGEHNVILRVSGFEQIPFSAEAFAAPTRALQPVSEVCTRVSFAVFNGEEKVRVVHQKQGDNGFGTASLTLPEGTFQVAVMAHSGDNAVSIPSLEKMTANRRVTDTFYYYGELTVSGTGAKTYDLQLKRCVAMFRLEITDEIPDNASYLWFRYTGGSSTLSAYTGYGSVNSTQTETRTIDAGQKQFDIYTFPHDETDELKITIRAFDANDNILAEKEFDDVPVTRNMITRYAGAFFCGAGQGQTTENTLLLTAETGWAGEEYYSF